MERLADHGYVPMDHRELRFSFRQPRDITHPDLMIASAQIARGDRQLLNEAKRVENENRRVWFFMTFPCDSSTRKDGKSVVKVDLLIATPYGAMVIKVLDWSGPCVTAPGEKWTETKIDGSKVEHPNQLSELDLAAQWVRLFLETKGVCPATITSYVLFSSPHAKPSFTSDPRLVTGPGACTALVCGNGLSNELAQSKTYVEWGQSALKTVIGKVKTVRRNSQGTGTTQPANGGELQDAEQIQWSRLQACLDSLPQFDLLFLRKNGCYIFGQLKGIEDPAGPKSDTAKMLEKFFNRSAAKIFRFEHSSNGLMGIPMAFVSGGLGLEPTCRVKQLSWNGTLLSSIDVSTQVRLIFRVYGCEGLVAAELNDIDILELPRVPKSMTIAEDGTDSGVVDQIGAMIGGMLTKSLQNGVKQMLPFPLNTIVN